MATERSDRAYEQWLAGTQQFDYFIVGLCVTLVGYLGSQRLDAVIGSNPGTLRLSAGALLLFAAFSGLKRIQSHLRLLIVMQRRLYAEETKGAHVQVALQGGTHVNVSSGRLMGSEEAEVVAEVADEHITMLKAEQSSLIARTEVWQRLRDLLLTLGLAALIAAQWWTALRGAGVTSPAG